MRRRRFLQLTAASPFLPTLLRAAPVSVAGPVVLLVELQGGNDGLNTVVPYADPAYARLRPQLAIPRDAVLPLGAALGLAPELEPLMAAWKAGDLAVALGVGMPDPNRSHFAAIDRWSTGELHPRDPTGWVAKALGSRAGDLEGVVLGGEPGPLEGPRCLELSDPDSFLRQAAALRPMPSPEGPPALDHLVRTRRSVRAAAATLRAALERQPEPDGFSRTPLGRQLAIAARLIICEAPLHAIKVNQASYDTHASQPGTQARLLGDLADGLARLRAVLRAHGAWTRTLVMTYAEFGRRPAQNGSHGTDHGTAAPHFLLGGAVKGGLHGAQPSLTDLEGGDLKFALNFRRLYATAEAHWGLRRAAGAPAPLWG